MEDSDPEAVEALQEVDTALIDLYLESEQNADTFVEGLKKMGIILVGTVHKSNYRDASSRLIRLPDSLVRWRHCRLDRRRQRHGRVLSSQQHRHRLVRRRPEGQAVVHDLHARLIAHQPHDEIPFP